MKAKAPYDPAAKAVEAHHLLRDYAEDLRAGQFGLSLFEENSKYVPDLPELSKRILRRMCFSYLVLTLSKLEDLLDEYKAVFLSDVRSVALDLKKELARRNVRSFRNSYVAHFHDKRHKRRLTGDEIMDRVDAVVGDSLESFQHWIDSVVATCERIRAGLPTS